MQLLGRPGGAPWSRVLRQYNDCLGRPAPVLRRQLHRSCKEILRIKSSSEFFAKLNVDPPPQLCAVMRCAVRDSEEAGYHKWFWYKDKLTWEQMKKQRPGEQEQLEHGRGSNPRHDLAAQREWRQIMMGQKQPPRPKTRRPKASRARVQSAAPQCNNVKANCTTDTPMRGGIPTHNPFEVLRSA